MSGLPRVVTALIAGTLLPLGLIGPGLIGPGLIGPGLIGPGLIGPATAAPQRAAVPGPQTVHDLLFPTIVNGGFNVKHYSIKLRYSGGAIKATTSIRANAAKKLSSFSLDLEGLTVSRVRVDGRLASFTRHDQKLVIPPARPVSGIFRTTIAYSGTRSPTSTPDGAADGWIPTADGATVLAEPVGAMTWFPNNNTPGQGNVPDRDRSPARPRGGRQRQFA